MKNLKISIIVPVYNVEKYLKKCLTSLVNQTLEDIEIIVINDGSPDKSQVIIDEFAKKYPKKIKSYKKENGGLGSARNYGIKVSSGQFIQFVDSDDYIELNMCEKMYNKAIADNLDIVISDFYCIDEITKKKWVEKNSDYGKDTFENALLSKFAVWNKLYKREIIEKNKLKFVNKKWYEDIAFTFKYLLNCKNIGILDEPFYNYLIRVGSIMNNDNLIRNLEIIDAFDDIMDYLNLKHLDNDEKIKEIVEFLAIDNIYISASVRVLKSSAEKEKRKEVLKELNNYMIKNFPEYRKNKYIKELSRNRKIVYILLNLKMFWLVELIFKIKK